MSVYGLSSNSDAVWRLMASSNAPPSSQLLKQREPLAPYAVNYGRVGSAPVQRVLAPQYQPVGPTNPHRPRSALNPDRHLTDVSRHAPYPARLRTDANYYQPIPGYISSLNNYSTLNDPHLQEYYAKKFAPRPPSGQGGRKRGVLGGSGKGGRRYGKPGMDFIDGKGSGECSYKIAVTTGDKKGAATDAKVFIRLIGSRSRLPKTQLTRNKISVKTKKKLKFKFARASTNVFKMQGKDIGELTSIFIEHDGLTKDQGWYLDQIEITKRTPSGKEKTWIFTCGQWLSLHMGDCQISRELFAKRYSSTEYEVVVITGDRKGAGTDANISLTIFGKTGNTAKLPLKATSKDAFERNHSDIFRLKTKSCGPLTKVRIQHDNTGIGPGWYLERIVVTDLNNPKWKFYFPCGMWLAKDEGDGAICRDLLGSTDMSAVRKFSKYKVSVFTGDKRGAGTDANVYIQLFGELGDSGERKLDNNKDNFERGREEEFFVECPNLGILQRLRIGHDNSGPGPGWFLDKVIVDDMDNNRVYDFPCNRWLAQDEDDGAISVDLIPNVGPMDAPPGVPYAITVVTSDKANAGTSARVYVILYGGKGGEDSSGKIWLENGKFTRGRTDIFNVEVAKMLSPLSRIEVGHDNSGPGAGWHMEKMSINCASAGVEQWFMCDKWFALDEGDGLVERTLYENKKMRVTRKKQNTWHVWVHTSDTRGAGTDANVYLVAYGKTKDGEYKKSDEINLDNKGDNFESGQVDRFKVEMAEIGKLYKIRVGHDNSGSFAGWHLNKIEMESMQTKKRYVFECDRWFAEDEDDGCIIREIPAEGEDIKKPQPLIKYNVEVHTGKKSGAGTDANVFLEVFGEQGDTGERPLSKSKSNRNKFEKGDVDEFEIEAVTLKKLKKIRIGHDGTSAGDGWFLDKVVVTPADGSAEGTVFECNRWLDIKEDDGAIVREIMAGGSQMLSTTSYHVSVKTGDKFGAGTDANVYIKIYGEKGDTGTLDLRSSDNVKNKFERGRTDLFKLEATDIGKIEKIKIGHDGANPGSGWFLDEVRLDIPSKGENYIFACHRWLDTKEEDGQLELELEPTARQKGAINKEQDLESESLQRPRLRKILGEDEIPYEITVWTGDIRGAGTDANVFIQMYGELGKTEEYQLRNRTDNFERAQMEKFKLEAEDIGPLFKIRVGHDGKGMGDGWFLEKILVQRHCEKTSKRRKRRRRDRRVGSDDDDVYDDMISPRRKSLSRRNSRMSLKKREDSDYGSEEENRGRRTPSARRKNNRSRKGSDSDDEYHRKSPLSRRKGSRSRHSDDSDDERYRRSPSSGRRSPSAGRRSPIGRKGKGRHGDESDSEDDRRSLSAKRRGIRKRGGKGELYDSEEERSVKKKKKDYLRNYEKEKEGKKEGKRGGGKEKEDEEPDIEDYLFVCNRWFATDEDDGKIVRELVPTDEQGNPLDTGLKDTVRESESKYGSDSNSDPTPDTDTDSYSDPFTDSVHSSSDTFVLTERVYTVIVHTSDVWGAGTDANVFINITGEYGDTGERQLKESENINKFERDVIDSFELKAVELGRLKKVKIRHDNAGGGAAWHLDYVEIKDPKTKETYFFPCQRWLATKEDDGLIARELLPVDPSLKKSLGRKDSIRDKLALETKAAMTTYHVYVYTSDKFGAGTDANVYIVLHGKKDDTGKIPLKTSKTKKDKFERNQMDEFVIEALDIDELEKIKIGHDNAGGGGAWHLDKVEIDCPSLGMKWIFPCGRWLAKDEDDGKLERELWPQELATEEYIPCVPYEITTYTSDIGGSGTDADVYVVLYGRDTATTKKSLCPVKRERKKKFEKASVDKFVIELEDVGSTIEKIRIGHDGKGWGAGWHLDKVEVRRLKDSRDTTKPLTLSQVETTPFSMFHMLPFFTFVIFPMYYSFKPGGSELYTFPCKRWLARDEEDGAIERELVADTIIETTLKRDGSLKRKEKEMRDKLTKKNYDVEVYTGDVRGAGTDANVFLTIFGEKGDTGERKLHKSETNTNKFEKGKMDRFIVEAADLGKIFKCKIRHDNSSFWPDWFLDRVEVKDPVDKEKSVFYCERWLSKKKDDCRIDRSLYIKGYEGDMASSTLTLHSTRAGSIGSLDSLQSTDRFAKSPRVARRQLQEIPEGPTIPYTVKVTTGDEKDMGTESNAWIRIMGKKKKKDTGRLYLDFVQKSGFTPGTTETFSLEAVDVDDVKEIELGHDGVTEGTGWYVKEVEIDMPTKGKHYFFTCKQWLARDKGDGKTTRMFSLQDGDSSMVSYKPMVSYELTISTGDCKDAGTDSKVFVKFFGEKGATSDVHLDKLSERFERARQDLVKLELEDVGVLKKMRIGHDGSGSRPEWFVEQVSLRNMDTHDLYVFECREWLSKKKEGGKLERDLVAVLNGKKQLKKTGYKISVKTSNIRGAGTDANVFVIIFGQNGDSGELHLKESAKFKDPFENDHTDEFTFTELLSLGQLTKVRVWHDNKGLGSAWHLAYIEVQDLSTKITYKFPCDRWLSKSQDDKQIVRELVCANLPSPGTKDKITYDISVTTTDKKDAGMLHNAWIILKGELKTSKEFFMENSSKRKILRRGQTDSFKMISRNLGKLEACFIGAIERDDKQLGRVDGHEAQWHCHEVVVTDTATGDKYSFPCKQWINITADVSRKHAKTLEVKKVEESQLSAVRNLSSVKYDVTVVTGDVKGAGTDANVQLNIYGENGDTGKRPLQQRFRDLFERNQTDKFQIEALDLGELKKIFIEHDNKGFGAGWFLERVEITNSTTGKSWTFPAARWLDKKKGDGETGCELLPRD